MVAIRQPSGVCVKAMRCALSRSLGRARVSPRGPTATAGPSRSTVRNSTERGAWSTTVTVRNRTLAPSTKSPRRCQARSTCWSLRKTSAPGRYTPASNAWSPAANASARLASNPVSTDSHSEPSGSRTLAPLAPLGSLAPLGPLGPLGCSGHPDPAMATRPHSAAPASTSSTERPPRSAAWRRDRRISTPCASRQVPGGLVRHSADPLHLHGDERTGGPARAVDNRRRDLA